MVNETWHLFTSELSAVENKLGNFNIPDWGEETADFCAWKTCAPVFHTDPTNRKAVLPGAAVLLLNGTPSCPTLLAVPPEESENKWAMRTTQSSSTALKNDPPGPELRHKYLFCHSPRQTCSSRKLFSQQWDFISDALKPPQAQQPVLFCCSPERARPSASSYAVCFRNKATAFKENKQDKITGDLRNYHTGV